MGKINKDHIDKWYDYDINLDTRTLWLGSVVTDEDGGESGVDHQLAERVIKGLHILESGAPNGDKPITIKMNNPGGDEVEGLAIYDAIKECSNHVTIIAYGKVWSMAGYILQAADQRIMSPNATFMLHEGSRSLPDDHPRIVKRWMKFYDHLDKVLFDMYLERMQAKNANFSPRKLEEMLKFDTILTAKEAVEEYGLADLVLGQED